MSQYASDCDRLVREWPEAMIGLNKIPSAQGRERHARVLVARLEGGSSRAPTPAPPAAGVVVEERREG